MGPSLSRSAIDALGKRLARAEVADPVDLQQLSAHQRECIEALEQTLKVIAETVQNDPPRGVSVHVTHRVKTVETLVDKLRRGTTLSRMQDLVGVRIGCNCSFYKDFPWFFEESGRFWGNIGVRGS